MEIANAMPKEVMKALNGLRSRPRKIMRTAGEQIRYSPTFELQPSRYFGGGSGRMASAGGRLTAWRTAAKAPKLAAPRLRRTVVAMSRGSAAYRSRGNR